jgi:hypothetical protein
MWIKTRVGGGVKTVAKNWMQVNRHLTLSELSVPVCMMHCIKEM